MVGGEDLFDNFEGKKEDKKKMDKNTVEIKIRFNKFWLERSIYIVIILVLLVLVFYNPFGAYRCEKGLSEITSTPVATEPEVEESTEPAVEEGTEIEEEPETEIEPETEKELSGNVVLTIDKIELDENNTRVKSITVKIDNQKSIFTPLLYVYWYDTDSSDAMKAYPNGGKINFTGPIPVGKISVKKLDDELQAHYLRTDDEKREFFKIELYDRKDKTLLDTKSKSVATD